MLASATRDAVLDPNIRPRIEYQNDTLRGTFALVMSASSASTTALPLPEQRRNGDAAQSPLLAISNETVRLYKQAFGRGPTRARTLFADANTILILLEDALTAGEQTLLDAGADEQFREFRRVIQGVLEPALRSLVERTLGRGTRALIAGIDASRATSAHVITLEPAASAGAASVSAAAGRAPR